MLNFDRVPQKSADEREFDRLNEQYTEKFGKPFVFSIGAYSPEWPQAIADIRRCIETGQPQPEPEYDDKFVY